jgi:hypothetical protein
MALKNCALSPGDHCWSIYQLAAKQRWIGEIEALKPRQPRSAEANGRAGRLMAFPSFFCSRQRVARATRADDVDPDQPLRSLRRIVGQGMLMNQYDRNLAAWNCSTAKLFMRRSCSQQGLSQSELTAVIARSGNAAGRACFAGCVFAPPTRFKPLASVPWPCTVTRVGPRIKEMRRGWKDAWPPLFARTSPAIPA